MAIKDRSIPVARRGSRTYVTYKQMRARCLSPKNDNYKKYGARGIKICDRWLASYAAFLEDMGPRPEGFSLDRIDNGGNYEPGNCRWASNKEQARNKRNSRYIDAFGERKLLCEWAEQYGITSQRILSRLSSGWPIEKAISHPLRRWN